MVSHPETGSDSPIGSELDRGRDIDGLRWKPILRANQCGSTKKVLRLRPWS